MTRQISHIAVGVIYHPPDGNGWRMANHLVDCLDSILQQHPYTGIVLLGDFNSLNDKLLLSYPLQQLIRGPTRGNATLDKIYTNIPEIYNDPEIVPNISSSDHSTVIMFPKYQLSEASSCWIDITIRSNDSNGKQLLANALANFDWSNLESIDDIDSKVQYFNSIILTLLNMFLPTRTVRRRSTDKPWVTEEFRQLIRCRQLAWKSRNIAQYNSL